MVCENLRQAHLYELGLTKIPACLVEVKGLRQLVRHLDESQGPSQLHGHGPWLVCEVVLGATMKIDLCTKLYHVYCSFLFGNAKVLFIYLYLSESLILSLDKA